MNRATSSSGPRLDEFELVLSDEDVNYETEHDGPRHSVSFIETFNERANARWMRLALRWRRIARLKRIWAHLGARLRNLKNGDP